MNHKIENDDQTKMKAKNDEMSSNIDNDKSIIDDYNDDNLIPNMNQDPDVQNESQYEKLQLLEQQLLPSSSQYISSNKSPQNQLEDLNVDSQIETEPEMHDMIEQDQFNQNTQQTLQIPKLDPHIESNDLVQKMQMLLLGD